MAQQDRSDKIKLAFPKILDKHLGIVSSACKEAKICRDTYYVWRNEDPEFAKRCDAAQDVVGDFVESKLYTLINNGNAPSTIFYCKTKLRNRGFIEKRDVDDDTIIGLAREVLDINGRVQSVLSKREKTDSEGIQSE